MEKRNQNFKLRKFSFKGKVTLINGTNSASPYCVEGNIKELYYDVEAGECSIITDDRSVLWRFLPNAYAIEVIVYASKGNKNLI